MHVIGSADGPLVYNPSSCKIKPSVKLILVSLSRCFFAVNSLCIRAKAEPTRDVLPAPKAKWFAVLIKSVSVLPIRLRSSMKLLGSTKIPGSRLATPIMQKTKELAGNEAPQERHLLIGLARYKPEQEKLQVVIVMSFFSMVFLRE